MQNVVFATLDHFTVCQFEVGKHHFTKQQSETENLKSKDYDCHQ